MFWKSKKREEEQPKQVEKDVPKQVEYILSIISKKQTLDLLV